MIPGRRPATVLELDLTTAPLELEPDDLIGRVRSRHRPRLRAILATLHKAGQDAAVRGLVVKVGGSPVPWAIMQELRGGIVAFAAAGKHTVAWAESFGEGGSGTPDYVLATACGEVWLQPSGDLRLAGVASETTFLRGALDKLGVEPQLDQRYEYKSAADRIMRTEFTPAHREAVDRVVASAWDDAVTTITGARTVSLDVVTDAAERAPLTAAEALEARLIDRVGYRDEVYAAVRERLGGDVQLLFADQWSPRRTAPSLVRRRRDVVAVVEAHGEIMPGRSRQTPRGPRIGSDTVGAALRAARDADPVRAVVLRVDSPGGSATASDTIWREVELTRAAGKSVVVSMGALAGSGGYYIACPADVIVAQPGTITGSIGVLGGKVVVSELLDKLGLGTGAVEHGPGARTNSARRGFTDAERDRLAASLDRIYEEFVGKVAQGRGMSRDAVHEVARGRVWSGADASRNGLVDTLGGLHDALDVARQRAGLPSDAPARPAVHVPPLARLGRAKSSEDPRALARLSTAAAVVSGWDELGTDLAALATALGLPAGGPLRMPGVHLR